MKAVPLSESIHSALQALDSFNRASRIPDAQDRQRFEMLVEEMEAAIRAQLNATLTAAS